MNNEQHGKGTYYWGRDPWKGDKYEGDWVNGERTGKGTYYSANGDKYEGDFVKGSSTGSGKMTWKDGTTITCQWNEGTPVNTDNKTFALWALKRWYYWNDQVGVLSTDKYASAAAMLNGVKYKDDSRSKVYDSDTPDDIFYSGREIGYGLGVRWNADKDLRVAYVYPGSPAEKAGVRRGWRITEVNGSPITTALAAQISTSETGKSLTLQLVKPNGSGIAQTLVSARYDINSVLYREVIQASSKKVGYIALKSFVEPNETEIKNAVSTIAAGNVQDLILDLRYCAGGYYEVLRKTASLLAPTSANGKLLLNRKYNAARNTSEEYLIEKSGGPNLNRIIVLTGPGTRNLGEYLIIGLQPYMNVTLIGSKTDGTDPYGSSLWTLPDKKQELDLVTARFENAQGKNSLGGLTPAHTVADGLDKDWGDREESLLKAALKFAETGQTKSGLTRFAAQSQLPVVREHAPVEALPVPKEVLPIENGR